MGNTKKPFQLLEVTIISAQDLEPKAKKNMRTYTTAWINPARKLSTIIDTEGGSNPTWNDKFVFRVDEAFLRQDGSAVEFEIYKLSWLGDTLVGTVRLLLGNLIPPPGAPNTHQNLGMRFAAIQVRRPSGRPQGVLNIGVAVLDSSKRSTPLDRSEDHLHRNNNNPVLSRSRSDRSEFLGLDSEAVEIPKKKRGNKKVVDDDKESSILSMSWFPPPPPPSITKETNAKKKPNKKVDDDNDSVLSSSWYARPPPPPPAATTETNLKKKGNKVIDDDKDSVLSASWYARPPPPPAAVTTETNVNKKGKKVIDDDKDSVLSSSWYARPPPPPPAVTTETNINKKGNKVIDNDKDSVLSSSWYARPPPPPPATTETNVNKKGYKFDDDKGSSILSMSWFQPQQPPPITTETDLNKKGNKVDDDKDSSILSMSRYQLPPPPPAAITTETNAMKGNASSVINAADLKSYEKGKAISVVSDSIMIKDSSPSGNIGNKIEARQAENKEIVGDNKNGPQFDQSPTNNSVDGRPKIGGKPNIPRIPGFDYGSSVKGTGSKLVIGGGPYKANSIMSDSEVGPSPSEVAAAMAERPRYPLEDSVLDGWSCDESVEGLRSRLERWRTELPPLYDRGAYAPTNSSFQSSSQHTAPRKRGANGNGGGPFSCFGNIFGYECQCVCGQPKPKRNATKTRVRSPSPFR